MAKSQLQSQNMLFSLEPVIPAANLPAPEEGAREERDKAQQAYVNFLTHGAGAGKSASLLMARFICRQVGIQTKQVVAQLGGVVGPYTSELPEVDGGMEYSLWDHVERIRFIPDVEASEEENKLLKKVLNCALPGMDDFLVEDSHKTLKAKMMYNAIGVCFPGTERPSVEVRLMLN
jgi:mitochondrial import receptor subunit TOM20